MSEVSIQFLGAAGTVTGSRFLLSCGESKILIEAGLFQGVKELRDRNWEPLEVDPASLDAVVLTHAHLDHCGFLPRLVKEGFRGEVFLTEYSAKLAAVILRDSASIQTEDAKYAAKKGYSRHNPPLPLYDLKDAERAIRQFVETPFRQSVKVAKQTEVIFYPAGHILGAAFLEVNFFGKRLLFTGDMGRPEHPVLNRPDNFPAGNFDAVITESTYGDREHLEEDKEFPRIISETIQRGGSVLIPAFAVDRTEVILVELKRLIEGGQVKKVPIYVDSPMALKALYYYREAIAEKAPEIKTEVSEKWATEDPFDAGSMVELRTVEESKSINNPSGPCIIISASGMATGGRVVHHLAQILPKSIHTVILVGYQALGTRGRALVDGSDSVRVHGEMVPVRAQIEQIHSFSVHADAGELVRWLGAATVKPKRVFVVHGEAGAANTLAKFITSELGWKTHVPSDSQRFVIE